jgi:hypothetical protein
VDEYVLSEGEQTDQVPHRSPYLELCTKFNVQPAPFDSYTRSLMSVGTEVLPCHYVPLAEAVHKHLVAFHGPDMFLPRLDRTSPNLSREKKQEARDKMIAEGKEYAITVGALRRTVGTQPVPLARYAPLEAAPDLLMME